MLGFNRHSLVVKFVSMILICFTAAKVGNH